MDSNSKSDTAPTLEAASPSPPPLHPLERYLARHAARAGNQTPDHDLLLLSIAQDTHAMLLMAQENQEYIRVTMDMQKA